MQGGLGFEKHPFRLLPIKYGNTLITDLQHINGTISMARNLSESLSSEFFICINDQPDLDYNGKRNPDG